MPRMPLLLCALIVCVAGSQLGVRAQSGAERRLGPAQSGYPIVLRALDSRILGEIAQAAQIPFGIEEVAGPAPVRREPVTLTGLPVSGVLEILEAFDPRYEWREMGGVRVARTAEAWNAAEHPLHASAPPISLRNIRARNALTVAAALLGSKHLNAQLGDTRRFSLNVEGTVLDVLNAAAEAHGAMVWWLKRNDKYPDWPFTIGLTVGWSGFGVGVPVHPPNEPVDAASYADAPAMAVGGSAAVLDRMVGEITLEWGRRPLTLSGLEHRTLAEATKVPIGIETLGPGTARSMAIAATGRTLRDVLDAMIAADPRYEWREADGVIVIRPVSSWNDPESPLYRLVPPARLDDVHLNTALDMVARALGRQEPLFNVPQGTRISLDLPQGTVLDLLNAIMRAHGEFTWQFSPDDTLGAWMRTDHRYALEIFIVGGGFIIPVR